MCRSEQIACASMLALASCAPPVQGDRARTIPPSALEEKVPAALSAAASPSSEPTSNGAASSKVPPSTVASSSASSEPSSPPRPTPRVEIGVAYALGDPHEETSAVGSLGPLAHEPPPDPTHPLPRVVIDVPKATGPLKSGAIQAKARAGYWGKVIECYRPGAVKDQALRGETTLRVTIGRGEVRKAKVVKPMPDKDVSACLAKRMVGLEMPEAKRVSTATMTIHVAPGDEPMPPSDDAVTRGPGRLDPAEVARAVRDATPLLARCYDAALDYAPALRGTLLVRIQVTTEGKVQEAFEIGAARLPDERLARCALHEIRGLSMPAPSGGSLRVVVPIRFEPGR